MKPQSTMLRTASRSLGVKTGHGMHSSRWSAGTASTTVRDGPTGGAGATHKSKLSSPHCGFVASRTARDRLGLCLSPGTRASTSTNVVPSFAPRVVKDLASGTGHTQRANCGIGSDTLGTRRVGSFMR